ncbi:MAG: hypothetical protein AB8G86_14105 [Saprospiraceae bacterium]
MKKENIHDKLFKHTLSIPSEAKALVRQFSTPLYPLSSKSSGT